MSTAAGRLTKGLPSRHRLPVTALCFLDETTLLSGEGSSLCINDVASKLPSRIATFKLFESQSIHGIRQLHEPSTFLIFGGRELRICIISHESDSWSAELGPVWKLDDWILDAAVSPGQSDDHYKVALITAHDALYIFNINTGASIVSQEGQDLSCILPGANTILYSAHLQWQSAEQLLVAAGTAFGDVVLWSCSTSPLGEHMATKVVHYAFSAHEGSLFGIRISEVIDKHGEHGFSRLLATSSDDRTIRVWDVSELPNNDLILPAIKDTGFGTKAQDGDHRPAMLAKAMGHQSRIWSVRFECDKHTIHVLSFGEDATTIKWHLQRDEKTHYGLTKVNGTSAHAGKHIWAVTQSHDGKWATGGADGSIVLLPGTQNKPARLLYGTSAVAAKAAVPKSYVLLSRDILFQVTPHGSAQLVDLVDGDKVLSSGTDEVLEGYSVVAATDQVAFTCGNDNSILLFDHGGFQQYIYTPDTGKTASLFAKRTKELHSGRPVTALLRALIGGKTQLVMLHEADLPNEYSFFFQCPLQLPAGTIISAFAIVDFTDQQCELIVGTRAGQLLAVSIDLTGDAGASLLATYAAHSDAVTSAGIVKGSDDQKYLVTTSRDGSLAMFRIETGDSVIISKLRKAHQLQLPFGPNVEGMRILDNGELVAWGFRNKSFVAYSVSKQTEIMTVECGGVHRTWSFWPTAVGGRFIWTKASEVFSYKQTKLPFKQISRGWHGREVKSMTSIMLESGRSLVATGAEDTCIKIFNLDNDKQADLVCLQTIRKHNTGPQQLSFSSGGDYLFSSGGFEEFFIWRLTQNCPLLDLGVVCESEHPRTGKSDLRVTSFAVDEESLQGKGFAVYMCYSDSRVALWHYEQSSWQHVVDVDYLTACPTGIHSFFASKVGRKFVTTSTDGHVVTWKNDCRTDADSRLSWTSRHQTHQSAILCGTSFSLADGSVILITGGDDNAIVFTRFSSEFSDVRSTKVNKAHAAAVTGLLVLSSKQEASTVACTLLSIGLDQRLILWRVHVDTSQEGTGGLSLQKLRTINTDVADGCGIALLSSAGNGGTVDIAIAGIGIQIITMEIPK